MFGKLRARDFAMLFNSLTFVVFLALVLVVHNAPLPWRTKKIALLGSSYAFYAAWNPPFVILLWLSTFVDWWAAGLIDRTEEPRRRRALLMVSVVLNLGLLAYFKYGGFVLENFTAAVNALGFAYKPADWSIVLPVGISFYTFQTMAYTLDVYLKRAKPTPSFLDFALFVTFFPQLVAGPIVRPTDLIPQFERPRSATARQFGWGAMLLILGLFEKVVLADGLLAPVSDEVFKQAASVAPLDAWLGTLAFSGQIFCDFAGYTTAAIGIALMLGFSLPDNFRSPYAAIGFSDFWRRWHISLSTWLRDYLYIPLGGSHRGEVRTYVALMLTMLLGGLWHGAAWTFVIWGGLHGLYLCVERMLRQRLSHQTVWTTLPMQLGLGLLTYFLVNITWVFFRAQDFATARRMLASMLLIDTGGTPVLTTYFVVTAAITTLAIVVAHWLLRGRSLHGAVERVPAPLVGLAWGAMLFAIVITQGGGNAFIYFQF